MAVSTAPFADLDLSQRGVTTIRALELSPEQPYPRLRRLQGRPSRPDFAILSGWDPTLASLLMMGIDGATLASAGVAPEILSKSHNLCQLREWESVKELQFRLLRMFDAMLSAGDFPGGFRASVQLRGFDVGISRQPLCDASDPAQITIQRELDGALNYLSIATAP